MERQLDDAAGYLLQKDLEERGIAVMTRADTKILGTSASKAWSSPTERCCRPTGRDGGRHPSQRRAGQGGGAGGQSRHRRRCAMRTSDPAISAVGECVEVRGQVYGLVAPLYEMAKVRPTGLPASPRASSSRIRSTKLKVTGIDLYSAGDFAEGDDREEIVLRDAGARRLQAPRSQGRPASSARCSTARPPTAPGSST